MLLVVEFAVDARAVVDYPPLLIAPASLIVAVAVLSVASMRSDVHYRKEAMVDRLTGCLNRAALARRIDELVERTRVTGECVSVIACDVDHFKAVNDAYGHARGDEALVETAARDPELPWRTGLRVPHGRRRVHRALAGDGARTWRCGWLS